MQEQTRLERLFVSMCVPGLAGLAIKEKYSTSRTGLKVRLKVKCTTTAKTTIKELEVCDTPKNVREQNFFQIKQSIFPNKICSKSNKKHMLIKEQ